MTRFVGEEVDKQVCGETFVRKPKCVPMNFLCLSQSNVNYIL